MAAGEGELTDKTESLIPQFKSDQLVHHTRLPPTKLSARIDGLIRWIGEKISWIWLVLLAVIITNVAFRHILGQGRVEFEELQWHLYAIGFLIGFSYCLEADDHVRVDLLHEKMGVRTQAWVELMGLLLFLIPFVTLVTYYAIPFAAHSFALNETSDAPGGLPARWAIKSMLPFGFILLGLSAIARLSRVTSLLFNIPVGVEAPSKKFQ